MKVMINQNEFINVSGHTGKMEGIPSVSTNKFLNENCKRMMNSENPDCICKYCYVDRVTARYKDLEPCLTHNTEILTSRILTRDEIKAFSKFFLNTTIVRFESFGDLNNEIQLINYMNLARQCKHTKFALFTKHFKIVHEFFRNGNKMPDNVTLVLSSPFMDYQLNDALVATFKKYHNRVITFTVTKDKHNKGINCGKRKCVECRNCYDARFPHNVIELVK